MSFLLVASACSDKKTTSIDYEAPTNEENTPQEELSTEEITKADVQKSTPAKDLDVEADKVAAARDDAYSNRDTTDRDENQDIYNDMINSLNIGKKISDQLDAQFEKDMEKLAKDTMDSVEAELLVGQSAGEFIERYLELGTVDTKEAVYQRDLIVSKLLELKALDNDKFFSIAETYTEFDFGEVQNEFAIISLRKKIENYINREKRADLKERDEALESIVQDIDKDLETARYSIHDLTILDYDASFYLALELSTYSRFHEVKLGDTKKLFNNLEVEQVQKILRNVGSFMYSDYRNDVLLSLMKKNKEAYTGYFVESFHKTNFNMSYLNFEKDLKEFSDNDIIRGVVKHSLTKYMKGEEVSSNEIANALFIVGSQFDNYSSVNEVIPALVSYLVKEREEYDPSTVLDMRNVAKALAKSQKGKIHLETRLSDGIKTAHDARLAVDILDGALFDKDLKDSLGQEFIEDVISNLATDVLGLKTLDIQSVSEFSITEDVRQIKVVWINGISKPQILKKLKKFDKFLIDS